MNPPAGSSFLLPQATDPEALAALLGGPGRCVVGECARFDLTFYDSFDWRLHAAGLRLARFDTGQAQLLQLRDPDGRDAVAPVVSDVIPAWPRDLPEGALRERVADTLAMRVLLPLVTVHCVATDLRLLNEDEKTVVAMQHLGLQCDSAEVREPRALWTRVRLKPVRGYEEEMASLAAHLAADLELPGVGDCLFEEALVAVGREAGDYSSKLDIRLKRDDHAQVAMRTIFATLLATIERNIPGTRADLDSEFLHDLRVATRRTRSALTQVKRVLPEPVVDDFRQRFAWLGQVTGPTRDLDVFLLELPRYRASLPGPMRGDLDALAAYLEALQREEQARLAEALGSERMQTLLVDWRAIIEADTLPGEPGWFADLPIERVASQRIWRIYRRVIKDGRAVGPEGPPEAMHELRKDCKKLRYLIEFFSSLYPTDELKPLIKALKGLLDILGDFQDLEVQAKALRGFAAALPPDLPRRLETVMAIGALVADLLRHQQAAHDRFADTFADFDSKPRRAVFRRLFEPDA
jgi:CHAD domain-containing protein